MDTLKNQLNKENLDVQMLKQLQFEINGLKQTNIDLMTQVKSLKET